MKFNPKYPKGSRGGDLGGVPRINTDSDGNPNVFNVNANDDGRWLDTNDGRPENRWNPENQFAFVRRKPHDFSPVATGTGEFCFLRAALV